MTDNKNDNTDKQEPEPLVEKNDTPPPPKKPRLLPEIPPGNPHNVTVTKIGRL